MSYSPPMSYPERLLSPDESVVVEFRPHWQAILLPISLTGAAIVGIALTFAFADGAVAWIIVVGIAAVWLLASVRTLADWWTTEYVLTTERVVVRAGVFSRRGTEIPLEVINNVAFTQSLLERMIRSGDLLIESAGESGQSRFTDIPDPEGLQSQIYQTRERRMVALNTGDVPLASTADELSKLAELRDSGVLSEDEFQAQKARLLSDES